MASAFFNQGKAYLTKTLWESGNVYCLLMKSGYSFNPDSDNVSDIVANECDFTDYVRKALINPVATIDDTNDRVDFTCDQLIWVGAGGATNNTVTAALIYDNTTGADSTRKLLAHIDWSVDPTTQNIDLVVAFASPCLRKS